MPASRAPEQVSQLGDKRRAVEPLAQREGCSARVASSRAAKLGRLGGGLSKQESVHCIGAFIQPWAPLCVGTNFATQGSSTRRRQLRNQSSSTRRRKLRSESSSMRRRQLRNQGSSMRMHQLRSESSSTRRRQPPSALLHALAPTSQPKLLYASAPTLQRKLFYTSAQTSREAQAPRNIEIWCATSSTFSC